MKKLLKALFLLLFLTVSVWTWVQWDIGNEEIEFDLKIDITGWYRETETDQLDSYVEEVNDSLPEVEFKKLKPKYIAPKVETPKLINFDAYFTTIDGVYGKTTQALDEDYIIYYRQDYFHHNTSRFMDLFWQCTNGVKLQIGGKTYTSSGIYHGYITDTEIYYDNGSISWDGNSITEMITCDGERGTKLRWILVLN